MNPVEANDMNVEKNNEVQAKNPIIKKMWDDLSDSAVDISYGIHYNSKLKKMEHSISFLTCVERFESDSHKTINVSGDSFVDCVRKAYAVWERMDT